MVVLVPRAAPWLVARRGWTGRFGIHAGVWVVLMLFLIGVWAAAGGGYFWPVWPLLRRP